MAIVLARVDNRLVHGQILSTWVPALGADVLVVLDDEAAENDLAKSAMEIAVPPGLDLVVDRVARALETVDALPESARAIVLVRGIEEAQRALSAGLPVTRLNLGNIHFAPDRRPVSQSVYLSPDEVRRLAAIEAAGVTVELKTLPRDAAVGLEEIRRRAMGTTA